MTRNPHKNPNPQGKGLVAVLADWQATRPDAPARKAPRDLILDWFVSTLVLSARFSFRPVVGQDYWLYCRDGVWQLSLVAPSEWGTRNPGACVGRCVLRGDMTWTLSPDPDLEAKDEVRHALGALIEGFTSTLVSDGPLVEQLPGYRRDLPYYQRLLATALGRSLRDSTGAEQLTAPGRALLASAGDGLDRRLLGRDHLRS